jgi:hypothetical protein
VKHINFSIPGSYSAGQIRPKLFKIIFPALVIKVIYASEVFMLSGILLLVASSWFKIIEVNDRHQAFITLHE